MLKEHERSNSQCQIDLSRNNDEVKRQLVELKKKSNHLKLIQENVKKYHSNYLIAKNEMDGLEKQIVDTVSSNQKQQQQLQEIIDGSISSQNQIDCITLKNPGNNSDGTPGKSSMGRDRAVIDRGFYAKTNAFINQTVFALQSNYTRSVALHLGGGNVFTGVHVAGHTDANEVRKVYRGLSTPFPQTYYDIFHSYNSMIAQVVYNLISELKSAKIYDSTMIVLMGEFANQKHDTHQKATTNTPWLVINSGKNGDYDNGGVHPGDVHASTMNRIGNINIKEYGSNASELRRHGRFNPDIL